jgi:hypothetical protein
MALVAARLIARLIALVLSATLAVAGLAVAVFSVQGRTSFLSLPSLARHLRLDDIRVSVSVLLADLQAQGPVARVAALVGAGAVTFGALPLFGVLARTGRLVVMRSDDAGTVAARPRALGQAAVTLGEQSRDVHVRSRVPHRGAQVS